MRARAHDERRSARRGGRASATACCVPLRRGAVARAGRADAFLFTHLHVRDDAMVLYGFPTPRRARHVRSAHRRDRGRPETGLAILSVHTPSALRRCLADDDLDALVLVPGVGKRTARRLLIELKTATRVPDFDLTGCARFPGRERTPPKCATPPPISATRPTKCATRSGSSPTTEPSKSCCAMRCDCSWRRETERRAVEPDGGSGGGGRGDDPAAAKARRVRQPRLHEPRDRVDHVSRRHGQSHQ